MKQWLRRARGALGMGVTWALVWAPVAVVLGTTVIDPDNSMDEMWVMVGALPGFLGGVLFSIVLGIVARRRTLDELSIPRVAAWGALAGFVVGALPFFLGTPTSAVPLWQLALGVIVPVTLLSAASAAASLALARRAGSAATPAAAATRELGARGPDGLPGQRAAAEPVGAASDAARRSPLSRP